jgi:hypothetical protein
MMKKLFYFAFPLRLGFSGFAEDVTIDIRYNVLRPEPSPSYFNWSFGSRSIHDSYDAVTGTSVARSTREFEMVRYNSMKNRWYTMPIGFRQLLLFPISTRRWKDTFNLPVYLAVVGRYSNK